MRKEFLQTESGNSLLEMLLFTPLAMLLLFTVGDVGSAYYDKSAIAHAIRSGLLGTPNSVLGQSLYSNLTGEDLLNTEFVERLIQNTGRQVAQSIAEARSESPSKIPDDLRIETVLVLVEIHPQNGESISFEMWKPVAVYPQNSHFQLEREIPGYTYPTLSSIIEERMRNDSSAPSQFASPSFRMANAGTELRYDSHAAFFAVQVTGVAHGILGKFRSPFLAKAYGLEEHIVFPLRSHFR